MPGDSRSATQEVLAGGGELGELMRALDWASTPLGQVEGWPQALKTCVRILLTSRQPMWLGWGDELTYIYNDPYKAIIGGKHPWALGRPTAEVWSEIWGDIGPRIETTMRGQEGTYDEALLLIMERHGYPEETYYTFSYSPVPDDEGNIAGLFCANSDDTPRIISERQMSLLRELATQTVSAHTVAEACRLAAKSLESDAHDLPFALLYLVDADGQTASLTGTTNVPDGHPAAALSVALDDGSGWPLAQALQSNSPVLIEEIPAAYGELPKGVWDRAPRQAVALPFAPSGGTGPAGVLVVGLSPYRQWDEGYRGFMGLVSVQIAAAIADAHAYEEERQRAETLEQLDRAKTAFFSNVSHEFRTPLTLMLGPLADALDSSAEPALRGEDPAPCLHEVHEPDAEQTHKAVKLLTRDKISAAVFLTGVGVRTIAEAAEGMGEMDRLRESLLSKKVAARGPKTQNALLRLGIRVDVTAPEPFTSDSLLEEVQRTWDLQGQTVLLQLYGAPVPRFTAGLRGMGASIKQVSPYRWERPADQEAVVRLIEDVVEGWVDVLAATSAAQVENLIAIARDNGYEKRLRDALATSKPLVAAQGIVCAGAFQREGIVVDVIPPRASMGAMLIEVANYLQAQKAPRVAELVASVGGTIAILPTTDVAGEDLSSIMRTIPAGSRVTVLAGKDRRSHRTVEAAAVLAGFAVNTLLPDNESGHPSDELVRKADTVLVITKGGQGAGRLLQLAHRYAKPVRLIRLDPEEQSAPLS